MTDQRLLAEHVVTPGGVLHSAMIIISDGSISEIRPHDDQLGSDDAERIEGWLVPGFVDTHCHGGGGRLRDHRSRGEALAARDFHRAHGSTSILTSLVADEIGILVAQLGTLSGLVAAR